MDGYRTRTMNEIAKDEVSAALPAEAEMRAAVERRDAAFDNRFVYGVVTTGVYCLPSCASRAARPENRRYFATPAAAVAAGFRACRRCRPDAPGAEFEVLARVARSIEERVDERLTLAELGREAGLSPARLQKKFKAAFGLSPKAYQDGLRRGRFRGALRAGADVTGAIFDAGYGSTSRVYESAARHLGMSPGAYRAGGRGETIHYACRETALGPLLMAATRRGVCFVQFGDDRASLLGRLRDEFPEATLAASAGEPGPELDAWIEALDAYLAAAAPRPELPLDLRGTAFQLAVWRCLLGVREGEVLSYGELAERLGRPQAARAVAAACAANRVGVLVPCHRVLRAGGELGGYRWGIARKRALLDLERRRQGAS